MFAFFYSITNDVKCKILSRKHIEVKQCVVQTHVGRWDWRGLSMWSGTVAVLLGEEWWRGAEEVKGSSKGGPADGRSERGG